MAEDSAAISIPRELRERLAEALAASGASSVDELAGRILRDWLSTQAATTRKRGDRRVSKADEQTMEDRLKALGYV